MLDLHCHTTHSVDGRHSPEAMLEAAVAAGLRWLAFTDHADFAPTDSCLEPARYLAELRPLADAAPISVAVGVEIGIQALHRHEVARFLQGRPFDYVIGSLHRGLGLDFFDGSFFAGRTADAAWQLFLEETLAAMESCPDFDVLGHLDILARYHSTRKTPIPEHHRPLLDQILTWLATHRKGLELNTSGFRYGLGHFHPDGWVFARFRELGGEFVTVGSDAHETGHLGAGTAEAIALLRRCGFSHLTFFRGRQPTAIPFDSIARGTTDDHPR